MPLTLIGNNTYRWTYPNGETVEIGDAATGVFRPHMKFNRWGECSIGLGFPGIAAMSQVVNGDTIVAENAGYKLEWSPTPVSSLYNEFGGYDWKITLKAKPPTNSFAFAFDSTNVVASHQPVLTAQEILFGATRPDHVVNSIAFFHATKGGTVSVSDVARGLTTGKIGHWYRMQAVDSSPIPKTAWLDWSLPSANIIRGTIDQNFLNAATYPVVLSPIGDTFGFTTKGGSQGSIENTFWGSKVTGAAGTGVSISAWLIVTTTTHSTKCCVYTYATKTPFTNGDTEAKNLTTAVDGSVVTTFNFSVAPTLTAATYGLIPWSISTTGDCKIYYDLTGGTALLYDSRNYNGWPTSYWIEYADYKISIYCTYTPPVSGWTGIAKVSGVTQAALGKIDGVAKAAIAKINGRAV